MYIYTHTPIFFVHSSVDGCLVCFHVLAIVNSATMNIGYMLSFQIRTFIFSCLKCLILPWNLCFVVEAWWINEHAHSRRERHNVHVHSSWWLYSPVTECLQFQWSHSSWKFNKIQNNFKINVLHLQTEENKWGMTALRGHAFIWIIIFIKCREKVMYSKKYDFILLANHVTLKIMTEKERER